MTAYRKAFSDRLYGHGLEIGALYRPMETHVGMKVDYVDCLRVEEMHGHYPELAHHGFIEPNFIDKGETLLSVPDNTYDFVIASHVIEHVKDPLGAIKTWIRVLKPGGLLYMVVPHYMRIFDKDRPLTLLGHLIDDHECPDDKRDWEHFMEWSRLVDKIEYTEEAEAKARLLVEKGYNIHFHTFTPETFHIMLIYYSDHIQRIKIIEPPVICDPECEFHTLIRKV